MDDIVKKVCYIANAIMWILFMFGIFLPFLISTDKLPIILLIPFVILTIIFGLAIAYWSVRIAFTNRKIKELKKKIKDYDEDCQC